MKPCIPLLLIFLLSTLAHADASSKDIQRGLEKVLLHKVMTIRGFYQDDSLTFSSDGKLLSAGTPGFASSGGEIEIDEVEASSKRLVFKGTVPVLFFDQENKSMRYVTGVGKRMVQVELSAPLSSLEEAGQVLFKVFYAPGEKIGNCPVDEAARYQSSSDKSGSTDAGKHPLVPPVGMFCGLGSEKLYHVGGDVKAPRPLHTPDPHYPEPARRKKLQGVAILRAVVTAEGKPEAIAVVRSLGNGFDELAADAVRHWTFEPATLDGNPVAVVINVEVRFRLY